MSGTWNYKKKINRALKTEKTWLKTAGYLDSEPSMNQWGAVAGTVGFDRNTVPEGDRWVSQIRPYLEHHASGYTFYKDYSQFNTCPKAGS